MRNVRFATTKWPALEETLIGFSGLVTLKLRNYNQANIKLSAE